MHLMALHTQQSCYMGMLCMPGGCYSYACTGTCYLNTGACYAPMRGQKVRTVPSYLRYLHRHATHAQLNYHRMLRMLVRSCGCYILCLVIPMLRCAKVYSHATHGSYVRLLRMLPKVPTYATLRMRYASYMMLNNHRMLRMLVRYATSSTYATHGCYATSATLTAFRYAWLRYRYTTYACHVHGYATTGTSDPCAQ